MSSLRCCGMWVWVCGSLKHRRPTCSTRGVSRARCNRCCDVPHAHDGVLCVHPCCQHRAARHSHHAPAAPARPPSCACRRCAHAAPPRAPCTRAARPHTRPGLVRASTTRLQHANALHVRVSSKGLSAVLLPPRVLLRQTHAPRTSRRPRCGAPGSRRRAWSDLACAVCMCVRGCRSGVSCAGLIECAGHGPSMLAARPECAAQEAVACATAVTAATAVSLRRPRPHSRFLLLSCVLQIGK
jgi:hypothetical protein